MAYIKGAGDLETIIAIQRASFKAVYEKYQDQCDPYLSESGFFTGSWLSGPIVFIILSKTTRRFFGFIRLNTNDEQTAGWIGTVGDFCQSTRIKDRFEGPGLIEEKFPTITQWDGTVFSRIKAW